MSRTNCFLPNSGFVLNLRVRMVNSLIVNAGLGSRARGRSSDGTLRLSQVRAEMA